MTKNTGEIQLNKNTGHKQKLLELLKERWSPRSFQDKQIHRNVILEIFDAGRMIMSSYNEQPWRVIFASKDDLHYQKLFDCLQEFNQQWVKTAPCLGVVIAKKNFTQTDKENRHRLYDTGAFMATSVIYATSLGLYMHQMAGFSQKKVMENFDIPNIYEAAAMFVIGKPDDPKKLPESLQEQEVNRTQRKEVSEFLFGEKWEIPY